ncbi:MAG: methyltransferase, partial [Acidiferrobacterales bacterium]
MNSETHIGPGIRLPPPVIYLAALLTGIVLNSLWAMSPLPGSWRYIVGSLLIGVSGLLITPVLRRFRRAGTTFDVRKAASVLITDGPYRFSRNPSYVSLTLLYLGVGIILNNGWI